MEYNVITGYLADMTMDNQGSWQKELSWPSGAWTLRDCTIVAHSDGGARATCSAAAWIVEVEMFSGSESIYRPVAMRGTYFGKQMSLFEAEAIALEESTRYVKHIIGKSRHNNK